MSENEIIEQPVKRNLDGSVVTIDPLKKLKEKKKKEILDIYAEESGLPMPILDLIWETCSKMPEKELKKIKKGQYKHTFKPNRPKLEDGIVLENAIINNEENKIVEV